MKEVNLERMKEIKGVNCRLKGKQEKKGKGKL